MRERYKKRHVIQVSLEMLLFDCFNILKKRKELKILWKKLSGLFTGIHLRDVLSHGDVLLENISLHLDQDDLPSNLIEKMLELIKDAPALAALSRVWRDTKPLDDEEFELEISKSELSNKIQKCPRWKEYMFLLPLERNKLLNQRVAKTVSDSKIL
ncbi:hypothetical protein CDAR_235561 [Caerostris darwini]|uniref:Uncharacterized protein n=1 Tax=Caerostris darwini TaxID=1538125 RepID=A0AAV4VGJ7_9ARAC|nr:hypothetical protein CDAR_235561 [Caerostris darwini]